MTEYINAMFLLVNNFKMIGMLLNIVQCQVQKKLTKTYSQQFLNHSTDHWSFSSDMSNLFIDELL